MYIQIYFQLASAIQMELSILMSVIRIVENAYVSLTGQEKNVNWQVNENNDKCIGFYGIF